MVLVADGLLCLLVLLQCLFRYLNVYSTSDQYLKTDFFPYHTTQVMLIVFSM